MDTDQLAYALLLQQPMNDNSTVASQHAANASLAALQPTLLGAGCNPIALSQAGQLQAQSAMDLLKLLHATADSIPLASSGEQTTVRRVALWRACEWQMHQELTSVDRLPLLPAPADHRRAMIRKPIPLAAAPSTMSWMTRHCSRKCVPRYVGTR